MLRQITLAAALALTLSPLSVRAAERSVVLDIKNADCVLCPPIVKRSLMRVPGVKTVDMKQADQMADFMATVTFDDAVATVATLVAAPTNAGYPTKVAN
jgi:periplasmic mercuric ion binding protein